VDNRWMLKLSCIVLPVFRECSDESEKLKLFEDEDGGGDAESDVSDTKRYWNALWTAPEILRQAVRRTVLVLI